MKLRNNQINIHLARNIKYIKNTFTIFHYLANVYSSHCSNILTFP